VQISAILAEAQCVTSAVTPVPQGKAAATGRIIVCQNPRYQGFNDTHSWAL